LTLGTGLTTVGFAFDRLLLPPGPAGVVALTKARTVAVLGVSPRGKWYRSYAPEARERVLYADSLDRPWDLPATTRALQFSPSGEWLLVFDSETHSFGLAEVAARRIDWGPLFLEGPMPPDQTGGSILAPRSVLGVRTPKSSTGTVPWAAGLSHGDRAVAWAGEVPYLHFRNSSEFTRWDGSVRRAIPEGDRIASLGGGKVLLLRGGAERVLLNLVDGAEVSLGTPASTSEACLSPSGRWLVMLDRQGAESAMLSVRDLDGSPAVRGLPLGLQAWDPAHRWTTTLDFDSLERLWLDFSPNDELALVGWTFAKAKLVPGVGRDWESRIALVNLLDGTTTTLRCDRTWAEQSQEDFDLSWVGWSASSIGFHSSEGYGSISSGEIRRLNANNPWYWHSEPVLVLGQNTILDADGSVMNLKTGSVEDHPPF
jgi:hypothetical protein